MARKVNPPKIAAQTSNRSGCIRCTPLCGPCALQEARQIREAQPSGRACLGVVRIGARARRRLGPPMLGAKAVDRHRLDERDLRPGEDRRRARPGGKMFASRLARLVRSQIAIAGRSPHGDDDSGGSGTLDRGTRCRGRSESAARTNRALPRRPPRAATRGRTSPWPLLRCRTPPRRSGGMVPGALEENHGECAWRRLTDIRLPRPIQRNAFATASMATKSPNFTHPHDHHARRRVDPWFSVP